MWLKIATFSLRIGYPICIVRSKTFLLSISFSFDLFNSRWPHPQQQQEVCSHVGSHQSLVHPIYDKGRLHALVHSWDLRVQLAPVFAMVAELSLRFAPTAVTVTAVSAHCPALSRSLVIPSSGHGPLAHSKLWAGPLHSTPW